MNKKKWAAALLISVFAAGLALTGCGGNDAGESGPSGKVTVSGSSALLPLAKDAAQKFKAKNDQVSITPVSYTHLIRKPFPDGDWIRKPVNR